MEKENVFVIPTDFTEQTYIALEQSYNLARFNNATILLLTVAKADDKETKKKLDEMAAKARKESGLPVRAEIRQGNIYTQVVKCAEENEAQMIVLGLESKIALDKIVGPSAFKLVRESPCPVLTIRGKKHRKGCENIVLPLDLTKETREKVAKAIEVAKYFDAAIRIVSVLDSKREIHENKLMAYSNQVKQYIKKQGVRCSIKTLRGKDVANMVINYASTIDADLIMIMSKLELDFKEMIVGSTAQHIINTSPIPVLSIRPMKRKDLVFFNPYG